MIDITGLREDKRPQSSTIVHALLDRLEAAEKDVALKERVIDSLGSELNAVTKERDELRYCFNEWATKTEWVQQGVNEGTISAKYIGLHRADVMARLLSEAEKERDALRAKIEAAERERDECNRRRLEAADHFAAQTALMKEKCDALRAKIDAMERQEPVAWARKLAMDLPSFGCVTDLKYRPSNMPESAYMPLYALPGAQAQPAPNTPEGWKLAPIEPTEEMTTAFARVFNVRDQSGTFTPAFRAALAAAPEAKP